MSMKCVNIPIFTVLFCKNCSATLPNNPGYKQYCSLSCKKEHNTVTVSCLFCSEQFRTTPRSFKQPRKYCSRECKSRHLSIECVCRCCGKREVKPRSHHTVYCSRKCNALDREKKFTRVCKCGCGKQFKRAGSALKKNRGNYCSQACYLKYKTYSSRSLNEELFFNRLKVIFPAAEANVVINNREADVLLRDQKIAIHWNGAWHYKLIRGSSTLRLIQKRDTERYAIFEAAGYLNYIIRDDGGYDSDKVNTELKNFLNYIKK